MHKKQAQFKGEMLDIIQTENTRLDKQITIKVDQISSLLELLTAEIQRMKPKIQHTQSEMGKNNSSEVVESPTEGIKPKEESATTTGMSTEVSTETAMKNAATETHNAVIEDAQYTELKKLVEQILDEQQKLQAKTLVATQQGINEQQAKQLKDINWLVSKQSKTLKEIKQNLLKQPGSSLSSASSVLEKQNQQNYQLIQQSLSALKTQLEVITAQQHNLQSQVKALQEETHTLSKQPKPYSYRIQP